MMKKYIMLSVNSCHAQRRSHSPDETKIENQGLKYIESHNKANDLLLLTWLILLFFPNPLNAS